MTQARKRKPGRRAKNRGWIIESFGISVYPTLNVTRAAAIDAYNDGYTYNRFQRLAKQGDARALKVTLHEGWS